VIAWNRPDLVDTALARVAVAGASQNPLNLVLIFGGGYDETQDNDQGATFYNSDSLGNRIFMVDALDGELLWYAGGPGGTATPDLVLDRMNNSIPSAVRVLDLDGNGFADRMYVGDTGGRLWRLDIYADSDPGAPGDQTPGRADLVTAGVMASLGNADETTQPIASTRKFYETPDVSLVRRRGASTYLNIALGSGWRGHPLNTEIRDRFYAIRDYEPFNPRSQADFNSLTPISDSTDGTGDLVDITDDVNPLVPDGGALEARAAPARCSTVKVLANRARSTTSSSSTYLPTGTARGQPLCPVRLESRLCGECV
jgi:type IV pilus assembly protein PilY1